MAEQDLDKVIASLKKLGSTSKSVQANSRYTPPASVGRAQVTLNDYRINALRAAPKLTDQINLIAQGQSEKVGALGTVGRMLIDNPVSKTVLGGLTIVDTPRRAVISGVREIVDLLDDDEKTKFSFDDLFSQTKDASYGFGTAFPMEGWAGRIVGFIGDVALDPLTYATFGSSVPVSATLKGTNIATRTALGGAKTVAGADGRFALARLAKQLGATDDVVRNVAARGRVALPKELAENMGIGRAGIYYFGSRVRVPLSGPIADAIQKGLVSTRLSFFKTPFGEKIGTKFALRGTRAQSDTAAERFALATGRMDPAKAAYTVESLGAEDMARAGTKIALDSYTKNISPLLQDPDVVLAKASVYRLLDTPEAKWAELGITPTTAERNAYNKLKPAFKQLHTDVEGAFKAFDPNFTLGEIQDYLPHVATEDALRVMEDSASPYAKQIREYLTVNMTDAKGSFRSRNLKKGKEWFGKILTQEDVDGGVQRLNAIARESVHSDGSKNLLPLSFDFFETDMEKILARYGGYYSNQIGTAKYMQDLFRRGVLSSGNVTWELSDDYAKTVAQAFKEASNAYTIALKDTWENGRNVVTTLRGLLEDATRVRATTTRPRGVLQVAVDDATEALKGIDPVDVAKTRLEKAHGLLTTRMNKLEEEFAQFMANFETESDVLSMLRSQHENVMRAHRETLETLSLFYNYQTEGSITGLVGINDDVLKAVDKEGFVGPVILDKEGRQLTVGETKKRLQQNLSNLDLEISQLNEQWQNMLRAGDDINDWLSDASRLPWDQPSPEYDEILDLFRDYKGGGRYSGLKAVTTKQVQDLWTGENVSAEIKALRKLIDPKNTVSGRAMGKMDIGEVRNIISTGFSSAANLNDLRRAGIWLVARDVILNGGALPTDKLFTKRLNNLVRQIQIAERIELLSKMSPKTKTASFITTDMERIALQKATTPLSEWQFANLRSDLYDGIHELERRQNSLRAALADIDDEVLEIQTEEGTQILARDLRSSDALGIQKENLEIQLKGVQADLNKKMAELKKFLDVEIGTQSPILRADEIKSAALGDFRKVAEDLSDALSIYYINSQTNILFSKAVEDAALAGHVPSERVYKTLVSQTARHDVESAQTALKNVLAAEAVLKEVRERVYSYQGKDRNMFMLNEFANIFMNVGAKTEGEAKKLLYQAEMLRAAFPEFEGIIASQMQVSNRLERAMFLDPLVSGEGGLAAKARLFAVTYGSGKLNRPTPSGFVEPGIAEKLAVARNASEKIEARLKVIDDELKSMGTGAVTAEQGRRKRTLLFEKKRLDANFWTNKKKLDELDFIARSQESGGQTGIRKQAGAKTAKGRGTEGEALEGMAETGVRQIASVSERASEWDKLWPELNSNMKKLRKIADNPDTDDSTRQLINGLVQEYDEAASRARAKMKYASDTLQRIVGGKSQRMQGRVLATLTDTSFGKPFGLGGSLKNALSRDSASAMDTFWADLMGGTKFDPRADYRVARVGKTRTGARKLVSTDNTAQRFVNVFPNEFSPTGYADADGRFVNATGELVAPDGTVLVDEVTGRPLRGRKSSKPTIPVRRDESHIGKVEMSARRRLNALRAITDDAEFIDIDVLQGITITPESPGGFGFDNLAGPRGYANQLEIQASMLDQKIQQATALEKRISKDKRALSKLNKPEPNARTQKLIEAERRLSSAAKRKKSQLEQSAMHTRALERQDFNNFLLQLSAMSEDSAVNANWGLNIIENPLPKAKVEHVYSFRKKALENQRQIILGELKKEQDKLNKLMMTESYQSREAQRIRARMTDLNSKGAAIAKDLEEVDRILRFDPQTVLRFEPIQGVTVTSRLQRIEDVVPGLKFGFSRDEWNALWTKPRTKAGTAALNNEYNALKAQLSALHRQQDVVLYSQFPYNFPAEKRLEVRLKIDEVVEKMDALRRELNMDAVRDDAIRKAKMLHQEFGQRGKQIYRGREVSADKALEKFMNTRVADAPDITFADDGVKAGRRRTLRQVFVDSEEGKHLAEFNKAKSELKTVYRDAQAEMVDNWRIARRTIQTNISNARKEIKELNIAQGVKEINETILKAEEASKGKLPKVAAKTLKGDVKKVVKGVEKNIRANRVEEPFFVRSEELFGSLEQANKNELSALQLRRRQVAQQIADMDYAILAEQTSQREAKEVVESLTKLSEREAAVLGLPSRKKLLKNVSLAKQLAEQTQRVSGISDSLSEKLKQIGSEYTTLSNAVTDARQSYNNSLMFRKTAEENVEQAKKAVESIRELSKRATKTLTETKGMKKDPALVQTIDNFLEEVNQLMPLIDDPRIDKEVRKSISIYMQSKTRLIEAETAKTLAGREKAVADGLKGLTAKELGSLDLPPGAVNIKVQFDEGFVELSRFFPNIGVRKELAEIVQNVHRLQDPALVRELSKVLGTYTKFFKGYATLSPGFHIRNAFSNFFMLFAAGGRIDYLGEGIKWSQMWSKMSAEGKTFDQFIAAVPEANRQMVSDAFMAAAASGGGMTDDALREGALFGTKTSRKVGRWIEQHSRFMLAYDGMRQGMDFNTSAARVRRFLIDYENVSSADQFMRQIIPFWMWTSRNLPLQVQNIWMNPKPYQIYGSIKRNLTEDKEEQPVPQWMEEVGAFRLPFGKDLYAVPDFGFNRVNQQVQELRDPARFMANLNPLIRLPIELSGGRQLYSNREFSPTPIEVEGGLSTALQPLLEALGYGETGPDGKKYVSDKAYYALRNLAPFLGTAERLVPSIPTYQQRGTTNQWLGFTGVPVRQNTAAMQEGELKRRKQLLQEFLSKQRAIGVIQED